MKYLRKDISRLAAFNPVKKKAGHRYRKEINYNFFRKMNTMFEKLEAISETSLRRSKRNNCCFKVKKIVHPGV